MGKQLAPFLGQPGRNGGTLRRGNPGPRGTLAMLQAHATVSLKRGLALAAEIMDDPRRKDEARLAAAEFIRRCTGIDRARPAPAKRSTFRVVREAPGETAPTLPAAPAPPAPAPRQRNQGPQSEKSLGGTRVGPAAGAAEGEGGP